MQCSVGSAGQSILPSEATTAGGDTREGAVEEVLPRGLYRVRLDDGSVVVGGLSSLGRAVTVRLIAGYRVQVRVFARDPGRCEIQRKL